MGFICYLLASLINSFKFALTYYLDSVGTSNEGLNTMANIGITTTSRAVDRRKKRMSDILENMLRMLFYDIQQMLLF